MALVRHDRYPGHQEPRTFTVCHCPECGVAFVLPRVTDLGLYDLIYRNRERVPGYARYARYAREVSRSASPLDFLSASEELYWAVAQHLRRRRERENRPLTVLDLGCGLGYLTYALVQDGFAATGSDSSRVAVAEATRAFGPHYSCEDLEALRLRGRGAYDVVVLAELIEHVDDVRALLATVSTLLRPGGEMIVTTPNKSNWGERAIWQTELPPLHLWWFSEQSMRWLAARLGCEIGFTDFSEFNRRHYQAYNPHRAGDAASARPVFAADGELLTRPSSLAADAWEAGKVAVRKASGMLGVLGAFRRVRDAIMRNERYDTRSYSLCAVLRKVSA